MTTKMRPAGFTAAAMEKVELIFAICRQVFAQGTEYMEDTLADNDVLLCDGEYTIIIRKATEEEAKEQRENGAQ